MKKTNEKAGTASWKVFRAIVRLNFEGDFRLFPIFGQVANLVQEKAKTGIKKKELVDFLVGLDNKGVQFQGRDEVSFSLFRLEFDHMVLEIEYKQGLSVAEITDSWVFQLPEPIENIFRKHFSTQDYPLHSFNRIGSRIFAIKEESKSFQELRNGFLPKMEIMNSYTKDEDFKLADLGYTCEFTYKNEFQLHIQSGPYQQSETKKFFLKVAPPIESGIMIDMDLYTLNRAFPGVPVQKIISKRFLDLQGVLKRIWLP